MNRSSIAIVAALAGITGCHAPATVTPAPDTPRMEISWARASGQWWADLDLVEPSVPVLLQRLPDGVLRHLGTMASAHGGPIPAGHHEVPVAALACPRTAAVRESGTERVEMLYIDAFPNPHLSANPAGTSGDLTSLSCSDPTVPDSPRVVVALFAGRSAADAFVTRLAEGAPTLEDLRELVESSGGRLVQPRSRP